MKPLETDLVDVAVAFLAVAVSWGTLTVSRPGVDPCDGVGDATQCTDVRLASVGGSTEILLEKQILLLANK